MTDTGLSSENPTIGKETVEEIGCPKDVESQRQAKQRAAQATVHPASKEYKHHQHQRQGTAQIIKPENHIAAQDGRHHHKNCHHPSPNPHAVIVVDINHQKEKERRARQQPGLREHAAFLRKQRKHDVPHQKKNGKGAHKTPRTGRG